MRPDHRAGTLGFTLIETFMALSILNVLAVSGVTKYKTALDVAQDKQCLYNRTTVGRMNLYYTLDKGSGSPSLETLVEAKYLEEVPECASKGTYIWFTSTASGTSEQYLMCSIHGWTQPAQPAAESGAAFSSDFNDMAGLTVLKGKWDIVDGNLVPGNGHNIVVYGKKDWKDYKLDVNATLLKGKTYGIYYRADGGAKISGYLFEFDPGSKKTFSVSRVTDGKETKIDSLTLPEDYPFYGQSHQVSISVTGDQHAIQVDGETVFSFTDSTYAAGMAGLQNLSGADVVFENTQVTLK
jgi:competence protein ComGC